MCKTLKKYTSIRKRHKILIPMRREQQKAEARKRCGRFYRNFKNLSCIMDNESIFMLNNSSRNGNRKFYTINISLALEDVIYKIKKLEDHIILRVMLLQKRVPQNLIF